MNTSVGQRIKSLLYEYRYKQVDLIKHLNWEIEEKKTTVSFWLRQTEDIHYVEFIRAVLEVFPQINPYWVLTGEGEKLLSNQIVSNSGDIQNHSLIPSEPAPAYKNEKIISDRQLNRIIDMYEKQMDEKDKTINRLLTLLEDNTKKKVDE